MHGRIDRRQAPSFTTPGVVSLCPVPYALCPHFLYLVTPSMLHVSTIAMMMASTGRLSVREV
jgi:hypothetical protein